MAVSLAIEVVLPQPFTPATMITVGPVAAKMIGCGGWAKIAERLLDMREHFLHLDYPGAEARADLVDRLLGRLDAHVRLDEHLEQLVENRRSTNRPSVLKRSRMSVFRNWAVFFRPCLNFSKRPMGEGFWI